MLYDNTAFNVTPWPVILRAGLDDSPDSDDAMDSLCREYWGPIHRHCRRCGHSIQDAEDITQAFFQRLVERRIHLRADPKRGRFRTFLLAALKQFIANWRRHSERQKRGGGSQIIPIEFGDDENSQGMELSCPADPARCLDREWADALLMQVTEKLEADYARKGKAAQFEALKSCLDPAEGTPPYSELAARFSVSESGVKSAVLRLRRRYGDLLRAEIAARIDDETTVDEEIRAILNDF